MYGFTNHVQLYSGCTWVPFLAGLSCSRFVLELSTYFSLMTGSCLQSGPLARGVQVGAIDARQIWIHPLGLCKTSKTNTPISPLTNVRHTYRIHVLPLLNRRGYKQLIFKNVCTGHTQNNGAVLIVFTIKPTPLFCVCPVYARLLCSVIERFV